MENLNSTPMSNRYTIGIFGRRNVGKSSLINAITNQKIAVTSDVEGTTTDPVYKAMELLPVGPVVLIDTAGLDDVGELGKLRVEKTYEVLRKCDFAIVVTDQKGITSFEKEFLAELKERKINFVLVVNKSDDKNAKIQIDDDIPFVYASAKNNFGIEEIKGMVIASTVQSDEKKSLVDGLLGQGDVAILVTPIDESAPKGRLILPQQQTIRDILDVGATAFLTQENELKNVLDSLKNPPKIVITDSKVFKTVSRDVPPHIPLTSFSILFARQKADIAEMVRGVKFVEKLSDGDKVLIVEGCTHHRKDDDIGTVKIPNLINKMTGKNIEYEWASGAHYPKDIDKYDLIIHCGGCMLNDKEMQYRVSKAKRKGLHITNYGVFLAYVTQTFPRALEPFPQAMFALK